MRGKRQTLAAFIITALRRRFRRLAIAPFSAAPFSHGSLRPASTAALSSSRRHLGRVDALVTTRLSPPRPASVPQRSAPLASKQMRGPTRRHPARQAFVRSDMFGPRANAPDAPRPAPRPSGVSRVELSRYRQPESRTLPPCRNPLRNPPRASRSTRAPLEVPLSAPIHNPLALSCATATCRGASVFGTVCMWPRSRVPCRTAGRCILGRLPAFIISPSTEFDAAESARLRRCMSAHPPILARGVWMLPRFDGGWHMAALTIRKRAKACPTPSCCCCQRTFLIRHPWPYPREMLPLVWTNGRKRPALQVCL